MTAYVWRRFKESWPMATVLRELREAVTNKVFWLLILMSGLGLAGQSWWWIPLPAVLLTLWSCVSDQHWRSAFKRVGRLDALLWF